MKYFSLEFLFPQPFKNVKAVLSLQSVQKQMAGNILIKNSRKAFFRK